MRLEMANFPVKDVKFSQKTNYKGGVLEVNKEELAALVSDDKRIKSVDFDLAFPGEQTRIVYIRDVVEPRIKVAGAGCIFPGIRCPVQTVGDGKTNCLSGVTVMPTSDYQKTIPSEIGTGVGAIERSGFMDMWGSGGELTPFSKTINIIPKLKLADGLPSLEAHNAIQSAEFKIAHRLAEATQDNTPEDVEVFELAKADPSLPRIVYIMSCCLVWNTPHSGLALYGWPIRESLSFMVHPNEFLDGALTACAYYGCGEDETTWGWQNQPMVLKLLREHGKQLNFLGVILQRTEFYTEIGKELAALSASQNAKMMGADGAIISKTTLSGNSFIEIMLTVQNCVKKGIKTVLMVPEWGGVDGTELPLVFYIPEATAMVSTGSCEREIKLPVPAKVIGIEGKDELVKLGEEEEPFSPWNGFALNRLTGMTGDTDWGGGMKITCREY